MSSRKILSYKCRRGVFQNFYFTYNRGGYQKFELLELYTNDDDNYLFVPYMKNSEPGLFDLIHNVFIPASGNGAYCE